MTLDAATRRNLELTETLRGGLQKGSLVGSPGSYGHADGQAPDPPVGEQAAAGRRANPAAPGGSGITFSRTACCALSCGSRLKPLGDLERLTNRVVGGTAQPRDLVAMRHTLEQLA